MKINPFLLIILSAVLYACGNEPEQIIFGEDNCDHCKMMITDEKFGAELITDKGKIYKYDSIECLLEQLHAKTFTEDQIGSMWVIDFSQPRSLTDAKKSFYLKNDNFRSPMGLNVLAFQNENDFTEFYKNHGGERLDWNELMKYAGTM
ncbi:MAG: nitrous oxide reductase accessory protein NosL [Ignavibacteriaceae bacterium]